MLQNVRNFFSGKEDKSEKPAIPEITLDDLPTASAGFYEPPIQSSLLTGEKFVGGFGATEIYWKDYWTLRARSRQLFEDNIYARGIVNRLITNEIGQGLSLEALPQASVLSLTDDEAADFAEAVETRFEIWGSIPKVVDHFREQNFGQLQQSARRMALISGDVLVTMRIDPRTRAPVIRLIDGAKVRSPIANPQMRKGHRIEYGVELDAESRQVAYWILQDDGTSVRLPAKGARSGRRLAWLVYGTDKLIGEVRGEPLLSIVLQSLKEIDRYRDSVQRKAVINSILAMFIKKTEDKMSTLPVTGSATRRDIVTDNSANPQTAQRDYKLDGMVPGVVYEELQQGEEPVPYNGPSSDINYGEFEQAILQAVAWCYEIPPEIMMLSFSSNYSASQAAINEMRMYLDRSRSNIGTALCQPIYIDFLINEVMTDRIVIPGFIQIWQDPRRWTEYGAWTFAKWPGSVKPAADINKQTLGYKEQVQMGWITNAKATRELTGTKFSRNLKVLARENQLKADAGVVSSEQAPEDMAPPNDEESANNERYRYNRSG